MLWCSDSTNGLPLCSIWPPGASQPPCVRQGLCLQSGPHGGPGRPLRLRLRHPQHMIGWRGRGGGASWLWAQSRVGLWHCIFVWMRQSFSSLEVLNIISFDYQNFRKCEVNTNRTRSQENAMYSNHGVLNNRSYRPSVAQ